MWEELHQTTILIVMVHLLLNLLEILHLPQILTVLPQHQLQIVMDHPRLLLGPLHQLQIIMDHPLLLRPLPHRHLGHPKLHMEQAVLLLPLLLRHTAQVAQHLHPLNQVMEAEIHF